MALRSVRSRCFNTIETICEVVKTGDTFSSLAMLKSINQGGLLFQRRALALCDRLKQAEEKHQKQEEDLTRKMNDRYHKQIQYEKKIQKLETKKSSLTNEKERCSQRRQDASRRKQQAEQEKREAGERYDEFEKSWWSWTTIVGPNLTEYNREKVKEASRDVDRYESDIKKAESEIACANSGILKAEKNINEILGKVENLKKRREDCHKKLGDVKSMVSFIMQAVTFWNEVVEVTKAATVKTEHIQRIVGMAARENTVKILKSKGTQILMNSFKECWMEVVEMITSDDNNLVLTGKGNTCGTLLLQ